MVCTCLVNLLLTKDFCLLPDFPSDRSICSNLAGEDKNTVDVGKMSGKSQQSSPISEGKVNKVQSAIRLHGQRVRSDFLEIDAEISLSFVSLVLLFPWCLCFLGVDRVTEQAHRPNTQKLSKICLKIVFSARPDDFWDIFPTFPVSGLSNDSPVAILGLFESFCLFLKMVLKGSQR